MEDIIVAGVTKLYCVGMGGGFMGSDGVNPIYFQILVEDGSRRALLVRCYEQNVKLLRSN